MTLLIEPGLARVTDTDGHVTLNTTEKLFYLRPVDRLQGSVSLPTRITPFSTVLNYSIGSCHPSAQFLRGRARVTGYLGADGAGGVPIDTWINISGTYVHSYSVWLYMGYTFLQSGGVVTMEESAHARAVTTGTGQAFSVFGFTLQYDLLFGQFT